MSPIVRRLLASLAVLAVLGSVAAVSIPYVKQRLVVAYTPAYAAPRVPKKALGKADWVVVADGFEQITDIQFVPGGGGRALVLEKKGTARLVDLRRAGEAAPPVVKPETLVLSRNVRDESELGLLGLAFAPSYRETGLFYVNYNPAGGKLRTRISELRLRPGEIGKREAHDERTLFEVLQPYQNHNGGQLQFGPDGLLYVGLGDGGFRADPQGNGQRLDTLLGKMLRIDPRARGQAAYGIPPDNPFVGRADTRGEIWAYGLRNPWRFSFDPHGRLLAADVGQDLFEEVDLIARGDNLGWNVREAAHCFAPSEGCRTAGLVEPIFEYGRDLGTSITGGYVYTGEAVPDLQGQYVFGDFTSGRIWALRLPGPHIPGERATVRELGQWPVLISTFGRDEAGEMYFGDYATGRIYRLVQR